MSRAGLLQGLLLAVGLLLAMQFLVQKLGLTTTLVLLAVIAMFVGLGYLVSSGHPVAGKLASNPVTRPLIRFVCWIGGLPMPAPPTGAKSSVGGPAVRTPSDFQNLNVRLKSLILGQDAAIDSLTDALRQAITLRVRVGDNAPQRRPLAVCFIVGGNGLGKRTLLQALGEAVYPRGRVSTINLASDEDPVARLCQLLTAEPSHTVILERFESAGPKVLDAVNRAVETGELLDPTSGAPVAVGSCVFGITTTDLELSARLGPSYQAVTGRAIRFQPPEPGTIAQVVVRLMQSECLNHKMILDYADEAVVVRVASGFDPAHGFRLTAAQVSDVLAPEIFKAIEHQHDRLAIVEENS